MQHSLFDFLCSSLVPELCSDIPARSARNIHSGLISVPAHRALPYELAVMIRYDLNLAVVSALLAVIALCVEFCVHDIVVNILHYSQNRINVMHHVRDFHVADGSSRRKCLEFRLELQLRKGIDLLRYMDMVTVRNIVSVCDARNRTETLLQTFCKFICC